MNRKTQNLSDSLKKVLGSASAEDDNFFDVSDSSTDDSSAEEITEDEVNEAMNEENDSSDDSNDSSTEETDIETEIKIEEDNSEDSTNEDLNVSMDEETGELVNSDDSDDSSSEDDFSNDDSNDSSFDASSDDSSDDSSAEITEEDVVEVDDVQEVSDDSDDYSNEENVVEIGNIQEVSDSDIDNASNDVDNELNDDSSDDSSTEEITDDDLIGSGEVEEITDEDLENASSEEADSIADVVIDDEATGSATELLASRGYQFETDKKGRICITACDESQSNIEVVETIPDDLQVAPTDVNLVLHESASEDPFYSVLIKGKPVASIHLKDQVSTDEKSEEDKRNFFISSSYVKALTDAMVKGGVNSVLDSTNAKRFTASVKSCELAKEMKEEAKAEMDSEIKAAVVQAKDKFIECVKLAIAGMNKNFFTNDNDFKGQVYNAFASFGASNEVASRETEKVFARADSFFASVVDKAQELMGFDENSFKTIASAVDASGVAHREVETFESKMMKGNNPVVAGFAKPEEQKVTASATNGKKLVFRKHIA